DEPDHPQLQETQEPEVSQQQVQPIQQLEVQQETKPQESQPATQETQGDQPTQRTDGNKPVVGTYTTKGKRSKNEDAFVAFTAMEGDPTCAFFGIYDGHGGRKASAFCTYIIVFTYPSGCFDMDILQRSKEAT